jgi:hypothetical protein
MTTGQPASFRTEMLPALLGVRTCCSIRLRSGGGAGPLRAAPERAGPRQGDLSLDVCEMERGAPAEDAIRSEISGTGEAQPSVQMKRAAGTTEQWLGPGGRSQSAKHRSCLH